MTMIDSFGYNIRSAFSRFFIETLSEKQNPFEVLDSEDSTIRSVKKMGLESAVVIHFKHNQIVGLTLLGEEYSSDPIYFSEGFEAVFAPLFEEEGQEGEKKSTEIHPLRLISLLKSLQGIRIAGLLLDVPLSKVILSFATKDESQKDLSKDSAPGEVS